MDFRFQSENRWRNEDEGKRREGRGKYSAGAQIKRDHNKEYGDGKIKAVREHKRVYIYVKENGG